MLMRVLSFGGVGCVVSRDRALLHDDGAQGAVSVWPPTLLLSSRAS